MPDFWGIEPTHISEYIYPSVVPMKPKSIKILLADDHKLIRNALLRLIGTFDFATEIVEVSNGKEALDMLASQPIDLILMDIQMPVMNGMETLKRIRQGGSKVKVLTLTQFDDESLTVRLLQLEADGLLLKACEPQELEGAILKVMTEGHYYNDRVLRAIENNLSNETKLPNIEISAREFQVLVLLKEGKSNKEIAKSLGLTLRTIESYRKRLIKKTRSKNTIDLIGLAYRTGMFPK
jgi:two-component system, NarL family, response regulator DegU